MRRSDGRWWGLSVGVFVLGGQVCVGLLLSRQPLLAFLAALALVGALITAFNTMALASIALLGSIAVWRVPGGPVSFADAILVVSVLLCITRAPWSAPGFKRISSLSGVYLVLIALSLLTNPSARTLFEWLHRANFLLGGLIVGATLAVNGYARVALRLYLAASAVVAVAAIQAGLQSGFEPAYPFGIHKNGAGFFLVCALLVVRFAAREAGIARSLNAPLTALLIAGVFFCQSRAAASTFVLILFVSALRRGVRGLLIPVLGSLVLVTMAWTATQREVNQDAANAKFNSIETREASYETSLDIWRQEPVLGAGLRFWYDPEIQRTSPTIEPHNVVISALGETGLVGLAALVALHVGLLNGLRRRRDGIGQLAFFGVIAHAIDSLAGIFWVAGTGTLPWLLVGLAAVGTTAVDSPNDLDDGRRRPRSNEAITF